MRIQLDNYRIIFLAAGLIGVLLFASPTIGLFIKSPPGEQFSELYLLGPGHMAENYPFQIAIGQNNLVYLGVTNHMGSLEYYSLRVKLANLADSLPNSTLGEASPIQSLYEYRFLIQDGQSWESSLTFSIDTVSTSANRIIINKITVNNSVFNVSKLAEWDSINHEYSYRLIFELWIYNGQSNIMQFNNRFADLQFNLTKTNP